MVKKEFTYKGKTEAELAQLSLIQYAALLPSRQRRKVKRGFTDQEKILLKKLEKNEKNIETHCRDMIVLPIMYGKTIKIYSGKEFSPITITSEMTGHILGEFVMTRRSVKHNAPGIGATKSSASLSVK
jgi:small subunit ribosomal protein S19